jgi:hypothetical protein
MTYNTWNPVDLDSDWPYVLSRDRDNLFAVLPEDTDTAAQLRRYLPGLQGPIWSSNGDVPVDRQYMLYLLPGIEGLEAGTAPR